MNPDAYIPLYGNQFLQAVRGFPSCVGIGYFRAIWHYWHHEHCRGLRNDFDFLQRICELNDSEWELARGVIFDGSNFFCLGEDGLWHQNRAAEEWAKSVAKYESAKQRGIDGANKRWGRKLRSGSRGSRYSS